MILWFYSRKIKIGPLLRKRLAGDRLIDATFSGVLTKKPLGRLKGVAITLLIGYFIWYSVDYWRGWLDFIQEDKCIANRKALAANLGRHREYCGWTPEPQDFIENFDRFSDRYQDCCKDYGFRNNLEGAGLKYTINRCRHNPGLETPLRCPQGGRFFFNSPDKLTIGCSNHDPRMTR
jgi:hypothetical protein